MSEAEPQGHRGRLAGLWLLAIGVVYGDIGTSPLYALREAFAHGLAPDQASVLGVLSLVAWSLILIVSVKYLAIVVRADNRGEGGILALTALVHRGMRGRPAALVLGVGLFGAALLYGDSVITPAISVLSAVEGVAIAAPQLHYAVIPLTLLILGALFWFQHKGTSGLGRVFGPITLLWFAVLALLGLREILANPVVLAGLNPTWALRFLLAHQGGSLVVLGAVFLVVTGGEAMYADLGHFGRQPVRLAWFSVALPALLLNYFGQGAHLLRLPDAADNPFYSMVPGWAIYPTIVLATLATVVASQAVITGAFSLTYQAVHLGFLPRMRVRHTSSSEAGQIYLPLVNWLLFGACVYLVTTFRTSGALAGAYGLAVSATMVLTTVLMGFVARLVWHWRWWTTALVLGGFLLLEFTYLGANLLKFVEGGWFPIAVAALILSVLATWRKGGAIVAVALAHEEVPMREFLVQQEREPSPRVEGTAVYLTPNPRGPPRALLRNLEHHKVRHQRLVILTIITEEVAHIMHRNRVEVHDLGHEIWHIVARYGFMEEPHVPRILLVAKHYGLDVDVDHATFFVDIERVISTPKRSGMAYWRERLFAFMLRNAQRPSMYYHLPRERVIEVGVQIGI